MSTKVAKLVFEYANLDILFTSVACRATLVNTGLTFKKGGGGGGKGGVGVGIPKLIFVFYFSFLAPSSVWDLFVEAGQEGSRMVCVGCVGEVLVGWVGRGGVLVGWVLVQ